MRFPSSVCSIGYAAYAVVIALLAALAFWLVISTSQFDEYPAYSSNSCYNCGFPPPVMSRADETPGGAYVDAPTPYRVPGEYLALIGIALMATGLLVLPVRRYLGTVILAPASVVTAWSVATIHNTNAARFGGIGILTLINTLVVGALVGRLTGRVHPAVRMTMFVAAVTGLALLQAMITADVFQDQSALGPQ